MISLAAPYFDFNGLIVMRDDADPLQFYYYPMNPQLATNPDGTPTFLFVRFKEDKPVPMGVEAGGGFLNFDVDLRVDPDALDQATRQIRAQLNLDQNPRLAPLQYRTGTTRLIFLDAPTTPSVNGPTNPSVTPTPPPATGATVSDLRFVENASYSATPALYGDNRTAFSVQLSPQGATLVSQCLDAKTFLAGVVYDLTFVGLRPAFKVQLVVDWDRVYDFMEHQFHVGVKVPIFSAQADIDVAVESLIEQKVIQFNVVSYAAGAGDADIVKDKDSAVDFVKKMITDAFFSPSIPPHGLSGDSGNKTLQAIQAATSPVSAGYTLKSLHREDVKKMNVDLTEQDAMEVRIVPQGHLAGLAAVLKNYPRDNYVRDVDLNDPFFQRVSVDVGMTPVIASDHIDQVQINFSYAGAGALPLSVTLNAATQAGKVSWELDQSVGTMYTYEVAVAFRPDAFTGSSLLVNGPKETACLPKLTIDPRKYYTIQTVDLETVALPWDRYAQVLLELAYEDAAIPGGIQQSFMLTSASPKATWSFRPSDPGKQTYRYRTTYYPTAGIPIVIDWLNTEKPAIVVTDVDTAVLKVLVLTDLDFTQVSRVVVTLDYEDPANNISQNQVLQMTSNAQTPEWSLPIIDRTKRDYTYAVSVHYADHTAKTFPPVPTTDRVLTITDTYERQMQVQITADGLSFPAANLSRIEVLLAYDGPGGNSPSNTLTLHALTDTGSFTYIVHDPLHDAYTYSVTYYSTDGFDRHVGPQTSNAPKLVIPVSATPNP